MAHHGDRSRRCVAAPLPLAGVVLAAALLTGCQVVDGARGCSTADQDLVDALAATALTGDQGDIDVERIDVGKTVVVDLPEDLQRFGADRVLASRATLVDAEPPSPDFPGIEFDAFVAISPEDDLVAPLTDVTGASFDVDPPDDDSWKQWAADVVDSGEGRTARSCVDPKA